MTRPHAPMSRPLTQRIQDMGRKNDPSFSTEEANCLEQMLRGMFVYEPTRRATATDVVKSEWMKRWGLPSLQAFKIAV